MTDSDSLRGDIDRPHPNLPQCCGELEILRALLRPRMAEAGDPTPTEALRGMFIEIERLRVTTSEGARCQALEESLTAVKHTLQTLRGRLHELLQLSMDGASDRDIFERIESLKAKLAEERKRTNILAETSTAEAKLARAAADGHDHAQALLLAISEVFGRVDDLDSLPAKVRELSDNCLHNFNKAARLQARVDEQDTRGTLPGPLPVSAQALTEAPCPKLDEPCHVRKSPEAHLLAVAPQVWIIEPIALPGYVISGRNASWMWKAKLGETEYALAGYKSASEAIAGARQHSQISKARAPAPRDPTCTACTRRIHDGEKAVQGCSDCYWLEFGDAPPRAQEEALTTAQARAARPSTARCPVCHRMAPVRHGGFEKHMSGDRICAGTCTLLDLAKARSQALNVLGWSGADDPLEWAKEARRLADERIDVLQAELGVHAASIADAEIQTEKLVAALNEKIAALDAVPTQIAALKDAADAAHAAMKRLGWDGSTYPDEWAQTTAAHYKAVRDALGVPADKPIIPYAQHAAKGMQALAILGWQDSHPVAWATKRAAAEADLRGAFAEAELVGSDHAAMVRQLWGNLRSKSSRLVDALARIHQLEIDNSKVHLEGRIELAEKRLSTWRAWVVGMCPESTVPANMTDEDLRVAMTFVPVAEYNRAVKALQTALHEIKAEHAKAIAHADMKIDMQAHTIAEYTRELKLAGDYRMEVMAARRGEVDAFYEALKELDWKDWSPSDISSPIRIFREWISEARRRQLIEPRLSP